MLCFTLYLKAIFQVQASGKGVGGGGGGGLILGRGDLTESSLRLRFEGLILDGPEHGGAYVRNFTT